MSGTKHSQELHEFCNMEGEKNTGQDVGTPNSVFLESFISHGGIRVENI